MKVNCSPLKSTGLKECQPNAIHISANTSLKTNKNKTEHLNSFKIKFDYVYQYLRKGLRKL